MSALGARVLSCFTKTDAQDRHNLAQNFDRALASIQQLIPQAAQAVHDKTILDFGSGEGWHALAFAALGARKVYGVDIEPLKIERSARRAQERNLAHRTHFDVAVPWDALGACDFILSRDSMEHYEDPQGVLSLMKQCLALKGKIMITFGPPWYSPYGAHMNYFTPIPWVHLLFSEHSIMTARSRFRADGARRYEEVPGGLNRMSVARFERLVKTCGLRASQMRLHCVRKKNWLGKIPVVRELFINAIDCQLD